MMEINTHEIRKSIDEWKEEGLDEEVIYALEQLYAAALHWKHEYAIAHNDALVNAHYASELEKQLDM